MDFEKYFDAKKIKGRYEGAVAEETAEALMIFCKQNPEFAQSIEQSGKTYQECLTAIMKGAGASLSDRKVFSRAVDFYFPGAKCRCDMYIDLIGDADNEPHKTLTASFDSLLDF